MGASRTRASRNDQRFALTLRGLRYLDHRKNAPEVVGTVVPWSGIRLTSVNHTLTATLVDENGKALGTRWRPVAWMVPYSQCRAVRWAAKRAERKVLDERMFDATETDSDRKGFVWTYRVILAVALIFAGLAIWPLVLPPGSPGAAMFARHGFHAWSFVLFAAQFGLMALLLRGRTRVNVITVRVFSGGIEADMIDGRRELVRWEEVRRIRRGVMGPFVVETMNGQRLRFMACRAAFVLRDWMERVDGQPTEKQQLRTIVIRCVILCQVGAIVGAALIARFGGIGNQTPTKFYLVAGILFPPFIVLITQLDDMVARFARWKTRGRAAKRREQALSSPATSAAK